MAHSWQPVRPDPQTLPALTVCILLGDKMLTLRLGLNRRRFDRPTDAFWTVNEGPNSVQKAKASSDPVDVRERFFDAVLLTLLVTLTIERRFCRFFGLLDLSATC